MFQPDLLEGKRILVTGGGIGLGRSIAHRYLELGANTSSMLDWTDEQWDAIRPKKK